MSLDYIAEKYENIALEVLYMSKVYSSTISGSKISNDTIISERIVNTPSATAKKMLNFVQEMGTLICRRAYTSARSLLDSYLIIIVLNGSGTISYDGDELFVKAGDLVFINCNTEYSHRSSDTDPWELSWLHFNGPTLQMIHSLFLKRNGSILLQPTDLTEYLSLLGKLTAVMLQKNKDYEIISSDYISRIYTKILTETEKIHSQGTTDEKMQMIKEYLEKNFAYKITLDSLSCEFCISKYYMTRRFKELFGTTIIHYLNTCRINHSKKLLRFTSKSVGEVAEECGFPDAAYFNKVFHDAEGITAGKYRKLWKN